VVRDSPRETGRKFFCSCGFTIWNCYRIATTDSHRCTRDENEFQQQQTEKAESEPKKVVNIFFKFLFPPTTTTQTKRSENARSDFSSEQADEKTGRITATRPQAAVVFAACGATERISMNATEKTIPANGQQQNPEARPLEEQRGYITKQEVARRLKKTVRTIENWQRRGYIPFIKAGRSVLFDWDDVVTHLQKHFRVCHLR
jgi:excisionase family DNA binding protein